MKKREHEPRLHEPDLPDELASVSKLNNHDELLQVQLAGLTGEVSARRSDLSECRLARLDLVRFDLAAASLVDCELEQVRVTTLTARDARLRRVRVRSGRIATLDLGNAQLDSLELVDLHIVYLNLADATIEDTIIRDCRIDTLDVPQASIKRVMLQATSVSELDTRGLKAVHFDLREAEIGTVTDIAGLRGSRLTSGQLVQFHVKLAQHLGITLD